MFDSLYAICYSLAALLLIRSKSQSYSLFAAGYLLRTAVDIHRYLEQKREEVDRFLDQIVPEAQIPPATL
ncbi:MAG: hypothetical protein C4293_09105, partial [Nitrospiraceae bacterium]